jgi:alpha-ketoglutarate-dependent taurine dioxygenase
MPGLKVSPLPAPPSFAASEVPDFGALVSGFDPATATPEQFAEVEDLLYKHSILVFRGLDVSPENQYRLTKHFDPSAETYGHGNNKTGSEKKSILVRDSRQDIWCQLNVRTASGLEDHS